MNKIRSKTMKKKSIQSTKSVNKMKKKTLKKNTSSSCHDFCKNDYINEIDKMNRAFAEKAKIKYQPMAGRQFRIDSCKNNFCNQDCKKNYKYMNKENETLFKKKLKNNFITNMKPQVIQTMKSKGAISYCDGYVFNPYNKNK